MASFLASHTCIYEQYSTFLKMKKIATLAIIFLLPALLKAQSANTVLKQLQGKWQSVQDKKSVVLISGYKYIDYYQGKKVATSDFNLYDTCSENVSSKDIKSNSGEYLIVFDGDDYNLCYNIDVLSYKTLSLFYEGAGKFLTYRRIK